MPLKVKITGWSPFIPTDDDNSGLPAGAIEYKFTNIGKTTTEAVFSFNSKNFLKTDQGKNSIRSIQNGFILSEAGTKKNHIKQTLPFLLMMKQQLLITVGFVADGGTP